MDEIIAPVSLAYSDRKAYFGFYKRAQIFDVNRLDKRQEITVPKTMVSAVGVNEQKGLYGLG